MQEILYLNLPLQYRQHLRIKSLKPLDRGIVYESTLNMNGYFGVMKTRYFHPIRQKTVVVRQNMRLDTTPQGLILYGSNPVDDKTNKSTDYFADNFLISIRPEGRLVLHCDNQGACSHVDFEVIKR
jgi:hypothetical protein